mgnify:CR=1 FL=1
MENELFTDKETKGFEKQMIYKVINSNLKHFPFPHFETEEFLPKEIIEKVITFWPKSKEFISNLESGSLVNVGLSEDHQAKFRYQINLTTKEELARIGAENFVFWDYFTKLMTSPQVIISFLNIFSKSIVSRLGLEDLKSLFDNYNIKPKLQLLHDRTDYFLGPHTDNPGKLVVFLIYFDTDEDSGKSNPMGTSVYMPVEERFRCEKGIHHKHEDFLKVFSANFKKNNIFSFCRTDSSFHGVEKVQERPIERKLLQYSIYHGLKNKS